MITANVIADSTSGMYRITTFELEYPRFIHAELMTHRVFSRNAASSRAIPVEKMIDLINENPAMPIHWGQNQRGMQADKEITNVDQAKAMWKMARNAAVVHATELLKMGVHKQVTNRLLEPFQHIKVVLTATEFSNFFNLRDHEDAQPEIRELAIQMKRAMASSTPVYKKDGEWHLPYISDDMIEKFGLETCKKISASCCAQVSYRVLDDRPTKALMVYDRLVESKPIHASPFEHQATPDGMSSNNFIGWRQLRQDIERGVV